MATIDQIVTQIRTAVFGKDVRESIAEGIEKCNEVVTNSRGELAYGYSEDSGLITIPVSGSSIIQGSFDHDGNLVSSPYRIRVDSFIPVTKGDIISFTAGENTRYMYIGYFNMTETYVTSSSWISGNSILVDDNYKILVGFSRVTDSSAEINPSNFDATVTIKKAWKKDLETSLDSANSSGLQLNGVNILDYVTTIDNYGNVNNGAIDSDVIYNAGRKCTNLIPVTEGDILRFKYNENAATWVVSFYGQDGTPISYKSMNAANMTVVAPSGSYYMRFSTNKSISQESYLSNLELENSFLENNDYIQASLYGIAENYAIYTNGVNSSSGSSVPMAVSNLLPVIPGGYISFSKGYNTGTYCNAFYDKYGNIVGVPFYQTADNMHLKVPDDARFFRMTIRLSDIETTGYTYIYADAQNVTPQMFGAVGDQKVDDSNAIQRALDFGGKFNKEIFFPTGSYLIANTLYLNYPNMNLRGMKHGYYKNSRLVAKTFKQTVNSSGGIVYTYDSNGVQVLDDNPCTCILVSKNTSCHIYSMAFKPNIRQETMQYDHAALVADGIRYYMISDYGANVDSNIKDCHFQELNNCVVIRGRNLEVTRSTFSHSNVGISVEWDPSYSYEERGVNIRSNRFHSMCRNINGHEVYYHKSHSCIKLPEYVPPIDSRVHLFCNNFADFGGNFIIGSLYGVEAVSNTYYAGRGSFVDSESITITPSGNATTLTGMQLFPDGTPANHSKMNAQTYVEYTSEAYNTYATPKIQLSGAKSITVSQNMIMNTEIWGHVFYNSSDVAIGGVVGSDGNSKFLVPEGATSIRFTILESSMSTASVTFYDGDSTSHIATESFQQKPIIISDNRIHAAMETDYSPGLNISESLIKLNGYKNVVISNNKLSNGVKSPINLSNCDKTIIVENQFTPSPTYCIVHDPSDESQITVYDGTGENYIKMTNCTNYKIYRNIAMPGTKYDGTDGSYVTTPVSLNGSAITADASNDF